MELARRYPDVIAGIGLIALALTIPVNPQLINMAEHNEPAAFNAMVRERAMDVMVRFMITPCREIAISIWANASWLVMMKAYWPLILRHVTLIRAVKRRRPASQPALIILAKEDKMTPSKRGYELAKAIPHAELVVIENAGHMLPVERSDDVNKSLRRLFEKTGA